MSWLIVTDIGLEQISHALNARVGLYTAGLKAYWNQFSNLKARILLYGSFIEDKMSQHGEVYNFGLVDDEVSGRRAGEWFNSNNVDIIFCHCATYVTSACILPIHQISNKLVIILNLQATKAMDYIHSTTGEWLAHCGACPIPEIVNTFHRANIDYKVINGLLGLEKTPEVLQTDEVTNESHESIMAWKKIENWIDAARVKRTLQHSRFGFLGNAYSGMLDMYCDYTMMQIQAGIHTEILEMCDLNHYFKQVTELEINEKLALINDFFIISGDSPSDSRIKKPSKEQLDWSARISVAQEKMTRAHNLDALTYYYHGNDSEYEKMQGGFIVGYSLLTAQEISCAGEGDLKVNLAMKICDIMKSGGSFSEIVSVDYHKNTILLEHDGPFHIKISDTKPVLRGMELYHGKKSSGVSVEAHIREGDITTVGISQTHNGTLKIIASEGKAVSNPIETGISEWMYLWNPIDVGYLGAYTAKALVDGNIEGAAGDTFTAGRLGERIVIVVDDGTQIMLGDPFRFDSTNIAQWKTVY